MTKQETIAKAKQALAETGITQFILRRGDKYDTCPSDQWRKRGWRIAETMTKGNVHAY